MSRRRKGRKNQSYNSQSSYSPSVAERARDMRYRTIFMRVDSTSLVGVAAVAQHFRTNFTSPSVRIAGPPGDSVAYVTFVTHEEANRAMQERGNFEGRSLKLSWAKVEDLKSYGSDSDVSLMSIDEWPGSGQLFNNHVKRRNRQKERKKKKRAFTWARRLPGINK